jgi:predicted nuclease with TOPRIM domain
MGSITSIISCRFCYIHPTCKTCKCCFCRCSKQHLKNIDNKFKFEYLDYYDVKHKYRIYRSCISQEDTKIYDTLTGKYSTMPEELEYSYVVHDLENNCFVVFLESTKPAFIIREQCEKPSEVDKLSLKEILKNLKSQL